MTSHNLYPSHEQATLIELDAREWHSRVDELIAQGGRIITFRGAGTVNGIDPTAAKAVTATLHDYVAEITQDGTPVTLMYDGDGDNRNKPDVGSVFGGLVDSLRDNPAVAAIAAQSKGWYSPKAEGGPLESASGNPYETYVFPDETPGGHAALTQSEALVGYPGYEQVFVGPAGPIAFSQLKDLSDKTAHRPAGLGPVKVSVFETPNNAGVGEELNAQLGGLSDEQARQKVVGKIAQREAHPYGAMFTPDGAFAVDPNQYPGVTFDVAVVGIK